MNIKRERLHIVIAGLIIGVIASLLVFFGNPANMGFCIACFLRDTAGGLGLHRAAAVQYIRPEIIGLVLGSFGIALFKGEFSAKGGSAPLTRFVLGFFVMIGCLMFLGCPFRMILRLAGGDLNALLGGLGFVLGILAGVFFLKKGYSLKRSYSMARLEGFLFPAIQVVVFILLVAAPAFIYFTEAGGGPGAKHAAVLISLAAGLIVGPADPPVHGGRHPRRGAVPGAQAADGLRRHPDQRPGVQPDPHRRHRRRLFPPGL